MPIDIYTEMIVPGSYIALHAFSNFELFYVCKVVEVCVAEVDCMDENGHTVRKGESFLKCHYMTHEKEKKGSHFYKECKQLVFVTYNQILSPLVNMSASLTLSIEDYQLVCNEL